MWGDRANRYARDVETLFVAGALGGLAGAQLRDRLLGHDRDRPAAEAAFAALVDRHAPMVLRVCLERLDGIRSPPRMPKTAPLR
jgi:hypothetical protein